jgi:hypothetical protein
MRGENLYCADQRKNTPEYRDRYDAIRWYRPDIQRPDMYCPCDRPAEVPFYVRWFEYFKSRVLKRWFR